MGGKWIFFWGGKNERICCCLSNDGDVDDSWKMDRNKKKKNVYPGESRTSGRRAARPNFGYFTGVDTTAAAAENKKKILLSLSVRVTRKNGMSVRVCADGPLKLV
jgi:hypothetical protein